MNCQECSKPINFPNDLIVYDVGFGVRLPFLKIFHKKCFYNKYKSKRNFNKFFIKPNVVDINKLSNQKILNYFIIILFIIIAVVLSYAKFILNVFQQNLWILITFVLLLLIVPIYNLNKLDEIKKFKNKYV